MTAIQRQARCTPALSCFQPKIHRPRNVDSTKKASRASSASGAPKTSPTKRLYSLHAMPNWNSCTMPVATPMMKLMRNSLPQNLVIRRYSALPVRYQRVWIMATTRPSPIVNGTIMKWYTVVIPNCQRAISKASMAVLCPGCPRCGVRVLRYVEIQSSTTRRTYCGRCCYKLFQRLRGGARVVGGPDRAGAGMRHHISPILPAFRPDRPCAATHVLPHVERPAKKREIDGGMLGNGV